MPMAFRADLQPFLAEFIGHRRGLRIGRMFGLPAGYAGRKMFVCLIDDGLIVKLPEQVAKSEVRSGKAAAFSRGGKPSKSWVKYTPPTASEARRLAPLMELAARHVVGSEF
jgi:hypothetical protein